MVKKIAEKTAGISMEGFQPRPRASVPQLNVSATTAADPAAVPRERITGVGMVSEALGITGALTKELRVAQDKLKDANEKLAEFDGATLVRKLDPKLIRRSRWANRVEAEFLTNEFLELKAEIESAGGNVQPIKVRVVNSSPPLRFNKTAHLEVVVNGSPVFEIVYGHRRHQACLELGIPVQAIVEEHFDDQQLFEAMDRENRARKNLSPWEQGRMYDEALKGGLYPSLRRLSESLGVDHSIVSKTIHLAKLPKEVVFAFSTPLDLQVRWSKPLTDALQKDPDGVLTRADEVAKNRGDLGPVDIFERLAGIGMGVLTAGHLPDITVEHKRRAAAVVSANHRGRTIVRFDVDLSEDQRRELAKLIEDFLGKV